MRKSRPIKLSAVLKKRMENQNYHFIFFISGSFLDQSSDTAPPYCIMGEIRKEIIITHVDVKGIQ